MKTFMANPQNVEKQWFIVDAAGLTLGRLASRVAIILAGKHKPTYTPNTDVGDFVIVINCKDVVLTGNKLEDKYFRRHTGYVGGLKEVQYKQIMAEKPEFAVYTAVRGMMPKNSLGRKMLTKLKVYADANHGHEAQKPVVLNIKGDK